VCLCPAGSILPPCCLSPPPRAPHDPIQEFSLPVSLCSEAFCPQSTPEAYFSPGRLTLRQTSSPPRCLHFLFT
jgi:hypothetical protein